MTGYRHSFYNDGSSTCTTDNDQDASCYGYFTCNDKCRLTEYLGCGDGVPSNGPLTSADSSLANLDPNQRDGSSQSGYTFEVCDDGNNNDGDGCTADCSAVEDGYECLEWGQPCTELCGNGHIEVYEEIVYDTDGITVLHNIGDPKPVIPVKDGTGATIGYRIEECDFGAANNLADTNDPDSAYKYPCTSDCMIVDTSKWYCGE